MALDLGTLRIKLTAATAEFKKEMADAEKSVHGFTKQLEPIAKTGAVAFASLAGSIALVTKAAGDDIVNEMRLRSVFGENTDILVGYADALEIANGTSQDASVEAMKLMGTMGLNARQTQELLPHIQDLSALMGTDLSSAAMVAMRAIDQGSAAMRRSGIAMTEQQRKTFDSLNQSGRLAMMMDLLGEKAGGMADKMRGTVPGAVTALKNSFGSLFDELGMGFQGPAMEGLNNLISGVQSATQWFKSLTPEAKSFLSELAIGATVVAGVVTALTGIAVALPSLISGFSMLGAAMMGAVIPAIPWILLIGAGIAGAIFHLGLLKKAWDSDFAYIRSSVEAFVEGLKKIFEVLLRIGQTVTDTISGLVNQLPFGGSGESEPARMGLVDPNTGKEVEEPGFISSTFNAGLDLILDPIKSAFSGLIPEFKTFNVELDKASGGLGDIALNAEALAKQYEGPDFGGFNLEKPDASQTKEWGLKPPGETLELTSKKVSLLDESLSTDVDFFIVDLGQTFEDVGTQINSGARNIGEEFLRFSTTFADAIVGSLGLAGEVIRAAIQGMQSGGPWGAIAAVAATLLSKLPTFQKIIGMLNQVVMQIAMMLEPILKALLPIIVVFMQYIQMFVLVFGFFIRLIGAALSRLTPVFEAFAAAVGYVIKTIVGVWNWILSNIADFVSNIPGIGDDLAAIARDLMISTGDFVGLYEEQLPTSGGDTEGYLKDLGGSADTAAKGLDTLSDSLSNVPQGFKVNLARYNAIDAGGSISDQNKAYGGPQYNIQTVNVTANNPEEFEKEMERRTSWSNYRSGGSIITKSPGYVGG